MNGLPNTSSYKHKSINSDLKRISRLYIQRRFDEAYNICLRLFKTGPRDKENSVSLNTLAVLFLRIAANKDHDNHIEQSSSASWQTDDWLFIVDFYGGSIENLPPAVLCAGILLLQKSKRHALSKDAIETWLASRPDDYYYSFTNEKTSDALLNYERIIELYCLHVLPSLGDWNSARDFLEWNNVLGQEKLELYRNKLEQLHRRRQAIETAKSIKIEKSNEGATKPAAASTAQSLTSSALPQAANIPNVKNADAQQPGPANSMGANVETGRQSTIDSIAKGPNSPSTSGSERNIAKTRAVTSQTWINLTRKLSVAIIALLAFLILSQMRRRLRNTALGRAMGILLDKLFTTAKMGLNVQTI